MKGKSLEVKLLGAGEFIRGLRDEVGISLRELAEELNVNRGTISRWESDDLAISLDSLEAIADALGKPRQEVAMRCLRYSLETRYPDLANEGTRPGKLVAELIEALRPN